MKIILKPQNNVNFINRSVGKKHSQGKISVKNTVKDGPFFDGVSLPKPLKTARNKLK